MPSGNPDHRFLRLYLRVAAGTLLLSLAGLSAGLLVYAGTRSVALATVIGVCVMVVGAILGTRWLLVPRLQVLQQRVQALNRLAGKQTGVTADRLDVLERQLADTGEALEQEIQRLKQMEHYRREFLGDVSHELKTPIFAIQGFVETLLDGALEDEAVNRRFLEKINRNAERLKNLVEDLLEISRIETGELPMQPKPFDVVALIRAVMEIMTPVARERGVTLQPELPSVPEQVIGDPERIRQVLVNLVDNAIKYNRPDGFVYLRVYRGSPGKVRLEVTDTGIGIPAEAIPRVTERFYRVDRSRSRAQGGTGLGLSIVKHILAAHETKLYIRSREGEGSSFAFELPQAADGHPS